jgi:mannose-6-phosphate isomerase-like protein (cupin superfamily)
MKRYTFLDLGSTGPEHVASRLVPGKYIVRGGLSFHAIGWRTHGDEGAHVHDDHEVFCIMQGQGEIEIDGRREPLRAGEVLLIEPGEDHHIVGDPQHPIINLWFHCGDEPHPAQREA